MKKTILKFIKSPAFDVFIFVVSCVIALFLYILYCIPVFADSFYDDNGFLTLSTSSYVATEYYDPSSNPVYPSTVSIPSGYVLVGYGFNSDSNRCMFYYVDPSDIPIHCFSRNGGLNIGTSVNRVSGFCIYNNVSNTGVLSYRSSESFSYYSISSSTSIQVTMFYPVIDYDGNVVRPENQIQFNVNAVFDSTNKLYFNASSNTAIDSSVSFYFFPSSVNINSGSVSTIIEDTYVTEVPASVKADLQGKLLGYIFNFGQDLYNATADLDPTGVIPELNFYKVSNSYRYGSSFDPSSFGLPYALLGTKYLNAASDFNGFITQTFLIDLPSLKKNRDGVYFYDDLALVAVVPFENRYFVSRIDFNTTSMLANTVVPPSSIQQQGLYGAGTVSDFQELADYLKYLFEKSDVDRDIENRNIIAYLQSIPWTNFVSGGVYNGLNGFLPRLSSEFDTMFNGLFTDFFVPDLEDIEAQVDEDEEAFSDKFQWVHDIKAEVNFIVHTPLAADDDEFVFKATIQKYSIGEVIFFDSEWIDGSTRVIVKRVITVFCTIALIVYIFKTLPSTLGNMPSD